MSHTVRMKSKLTEPTIIARAADRWAKRMGKTCQVEMNSWAQLYDRAHAQGTVLKINGWRYPVVVKDDGQLLYDDFGGTWGNVRDLHGIQQHYSALIVGDQMREEGWVVEESETADGEIKLRCYQY